jgi:hypothetical protein
MCDAIAENAGEPLSVVGKSDAEIVLPEVIKKEPNQGFIKHKRFGRSNYDKPYGDRKPWGAERPKI